MPPAAVLAVLLALAVWGGGAAPVSAGVAEPPSYRTGDYRAPVPATLTGGRVIDTAEAHRLWQAGTAVFVDVLPKPPKPALPQGTVWRDRPRHDIPGSIWLADVGYGSLSGEMEAYFRSNLRQATGDDRSRTLVFYCLADCWMSWNAAKRAIALGYSDVRWYPDGTDGWTRQNLPVEARQPVPRPGEVN